MKRITYGLILVAAFTFAFSSCKKDRDNTQLDLNTVKIGALLSLTGNWSSLGITSKAAIDIALEEINAQMAEAGSRNRFSSVVYDTKLDAGLASQFIANAKAQGCRFILGPQSSAEAGAVKDYAEANRMLVVSQGSTAGSLSIPGDNFFRFCPADNIEGHAMAKTIYNDGIRSLMTVARDDAGNRGLQEATGNSFAALGGKVAGVFIYSAGTNPDYATQLFILNSYIAQEKAARPLSEIAVYLASFDECVAIFEQAATYPDLLAVRWYGGDGTALSSAVTGSAAASDFAIATKYFAPSYGLPQSASATWQPLSDKIKARTGIVPDAFALAAYDAVWVMANTYNAFPGAPQFEQLKSEFPLQAGKYNGATGNTLLNYAGDRAAGSYDYWGIVKEGNAYKWVVVGKSE